MSLTITNEDNMQLMARYPDGYFDLAIVDPPYGIGFGEFNRTNTDKVTNKKVKANKYKNDNWDDSIPNDQYFKELIRVSKNQIVWGGNYFPYLWSNGCKGFVFWHKHQPVNNFSKGELAWTSFNTPAQCFDYKYFGSINRDKVQLHPTQKPVALYKWILDKYAKQGDKILDTHLGSGSIAIACHDYGFDLTACELDKDYYDAAMKRIEQHTRQQSLFSPTQLTL